MILRFLCSLTLTLALTWLALTAIAITFAYITNLTME